MISPIFTLGVSGIFINASQVLLVKTEYAGEKWQLPGGYVEKGETVHEALLREIQEELGVEVEVFEVVGTYIREFANNINIVFVITLPIDRIHVDNREVLDAKLFNTDALPNNTSPRTRRIVQEAVDGLRSRVVIFRDGYDTGTSL